MRGLSDCHRPRVMIYIDHDIDRIDLQKALAEISMQRREQALRFRYESRQRQSVAAYMQLKKGLQREYGIEENPQFGFCKGGKPYISGHDEIHFSLSHCKTAVACALSSSPVGIDIERIRPLNRLLAKRVLSETELQGVLGGQRPDVEFIRLWTLKESYLKLTGEGIRRDLKTIDAHDARHTTVVDLQRQYVWTVCQWPEGSDCIDSEAHIEHR